MAVETIGNPGRPCSSLRLSSVSAPNSQRSVMPFKNPRWHMMDSGEQRFFRLPFGSAPASRRARATDQCCPTRATNSGVCALTSRMSILAPAWMSRSVQLLSPAEKLLVRILLHGCNTLGRAFKMHSRGEYKAVNCYCHRSGLQADQESASSVKQDAVGGINMGASFSKIRKVFEFMLISVDYFAISI